MVGETDAQVVDVSSEAVNSHDIDGL
jgi:hypothetical protein